MSHRPDPLPRRPMTDDEKRMARALGNVTFVPGIRSQSFARDMAALAERDVAMITSGQAVALRSLVSRYRRQIDRETVALAEVRS